MTNSHLQYLQKVTCSHFIIKDTKTMRKNHFWVLVLTMGLLLNACSKPEEQVDGQNDSEVQPTPTSEISKNKLQLVSISSKDKAIEVLVTGRVIAKNKTALVAEVQGSLQPTKLNFKEGNRFGLGQSLISIDSKEFSLNLESQRSSFLNTLTAMMPDLKEDYATNYKAWLRYVEAYKIGASLQSLPQTKSDSEKYFITSRGVYSSYYAIKALEERLTKYAISAPYNGIITVSNVDVGGLVSPGQVLGEIISTDGYELEAGVALDVANKLKIGDQLVFSSNEQTGVWNGKVVRIGGTVDSQTQNVPVYFSISGPNLRPGMYLEGAYNTQNFDDVFVIHSSVLGRDESVLVLEKDLIVRKPVQPIEYVQDSVLVKGLANKDQLILNQFSEPVEGQKVSLQ